MGDAAAEADSDRIDDEFPARPFPSNYSHRDRNDREDDFPPECILRRRRPGDSRRSQQGGVRGEAELNGAAAAEAMDRYDEENTISVSVNVDVE